MKTTAEVHSQLMRQVMHWVLASERLGELNDVAPVASWLQLENYLSIPLRSNLSKTVEKLQRQAREARYTVEYADLAEGHQAILGLRHAYLRVETVIDFFADAINTRVNPLMMSLLIGCDVLTRTSMDKLLIHLDRQSPPVLTYVDKGLGASILKAGLRLWDGSTENPVTAIKIARHNLYRPTALIHEAGHQVAHILDWNRELKLALESGINNSVATLWGEWASEIAADAFAFAHSGYASIAALHDVVDGGPHSVFLYMPGDPHPISYVRVLLGVEMCRRFFGDGPWNSLAETWKNKYPLEDAPHNIATMIDSLLPFLAQVVEVVLLKPMSAFSNKPLATLVDPILVSPQSLLRLERMGGKSLYISPVWLQRETLRLLALSGFKTVEQPEKTKEFAQRQLDWMIRLGTIATTIF